MGVLVVPRTIPRGQLHYAIRRFMEERFRGSEKIEELLFINGSVHVKLGIPQPEFSDYGRLQYHDDVQGLSFEIIRGSGGQIMEG